MLGCDCSINSQELRYKISDAGESELKPPLEGRFPALAGRRGDLTIANISLWYNCHSKTQRTSVIHKNIVPANSFCKSNHFNYSNCIKHFHQTLPSATFGGFSFAKKLI
jgi:hypothetical protein